MNKLEFFGAVFAVSGAVLVAASIEWQGYVLFILSGACFIPWAVGKGAKSFLVMEIIFTCINVFGLYMRVL